MNKTLRLNIRVDSSDQIGSGHVYRCMAIAEEAKRFGIEVRFLYSKSSGLSTSDIVGESFECVLLPVSHGSNQVSKSQECSNVGPDEEEDANAVLKTLSTDYLECILVDHYSLQFDWFQRISASTNVHRVLFIGDDTESSDLMEQVNLGFPTPNNLSNAISSLGRATNGLSVGSYIPISQTVRKARKSAAMAKEVQGDQPIRNILVFLGNSNVDQYLEKIRKAVEGLESETPLNFSVLKQSTVPHSRQKNQYGKSIKQVNFSTQEDYVKFMLSQDLVIGAGGTASLERLFLAVPQIVFTIADNQLLNAKSLSAWGVLDWAGDLRHLDVPQITKILNGLNLNRFRLRQIAETGRLFVDGWGARRIVQKLLSPKSEGLRLRPLARDDDSLLFGWANELEGRRMSQTRRVISPDEHLEWFKISIRKPEDVGTYILEDSHGPIGQVRFERKEKNSFMLSYFLDSSVRGLGLSKKLVSMGMERHRSQHTNPIYTAVALKSNTASKKILKDLSFIHRGSDGDFEQFVLDLTT